MKVAVTQEHIDRGCRRKGDACPVYFAMRDAGIPVTWVSTCFWTAHETGAVALAEHQRELSYDAITFIVLFDDKKPVHPFEFEIAYEL